MKTIAFLVILGSLLLLLPFIPCCENNACLGKSSIKLIEDYLEKDVEIKRQRARIVTDNWENCDKVIAELRKYDEENKESIEKHEKSYDQIRGKMCEKETGEFKKRMIERYSSNSTRFGLGSAEFLAELHTRCREKSDDVIIAMGYSHFSFYVFWKPPVETRVIYDVPISFGPI